MANNPGVRGARDRAEPGARAKVAALVFVVLLVGALFWAMQAIVKHNAVQNCIDSGRRDCVPVSGAP